MQASPLPLQRLQLEESLNGGGGGSPIMSPRSSTLRRESHSRELADIAENEALNTEQTLQNVAAMFPTVDESVIRELLRK